MAIASAPAPSTYCLIALMALALNAWLLFDLLDDLDDDGDRDDDDDDDG